MSPRIIEDVVEEPIPLAEARDYLGVHVVDESDGHPDDEKITAMLKAAREMCEQFAGLAFGGKTIEIALDAFPSGAVEIPLGPLVSVDSITVAGEAIDAAGYTVDTYSKPGRVVPVTSWPVVTAATNTVKIRAAVGYGDESDQEALPYVARGAILLTLQALYDGVDVVTDLPQAAEALLRPLRIRKGMA